MCTPAEHRECWGLLQGTSPQGPIYLEVVGFDKPRYDVGKGAHDEFWSWRSLSAPICFENGEFSIRGSDLTQA